MRLNLLRETFSGQRGKVNRACAVRYSSVKGNSFARTYEYCFSYLHLIGGYGKLRVAAYDARRVRAYVHKLGYAFAAFADSNALEQLADLIKEHDGYSLFVFSRGKRADRGKRHEKLLVQKLTAKNIAHRAIHHVISYYDVRGKKSKQQPQPVKGQRQSNYEKHCGN